jgi:hypothetical protein
MDVRERSEPAAAPRCPYCHDLLEGEQQDAALVVCGGCGTRHHDACLAELGRCTVLGCTWTPPGGSLGRFDGARSVEELRRSVRERARRFVQEHASPLAPLLARRPRRASRRVSEPPWGLERTGPSAAELVLLLVVVVPGVLAIVFLVTAFIHQAIFGR